MITKSVSVQYGVYPYPYMGCLPYGSKDVSDGEFFMIKIAGIGFIVFGVISVVQQSFSYTQTKLGGQTGSLIIEQTEFRTVPLPPIIGAGLILAGFAALLVRTSRAS